MYVEPNFKNKKLLKEAVKAYTAFKEGTLDPMPIQQPRPVTVFSPGPFPAKRDGQEFVEGPHYPAPHTWYAEVQVKDGVVVKVK